MNLTGNLCQHRYRQDRNVSLANFSETLLTIIYQIWPFMAFCSLPINLYVVMKKMNKSQCVSTTLKCWSPV